MISSQHPQRLQLSIEDPQRGVPFSKRGGLFLTGPITPAGKSTAFDQVFPPSVDLLTKPDQTCGLDPGFPPSSIEANHEQRISLFLASVSVEA